MTDGEESEGIAGPADGGFRPLLEKLSSTYSFDFRDYKAPSLARRIRARMSQLHLNDSTSTRAISTSTATSTSRCSTPSSST